jgi:hypothetical protein
VAHCSITGETVLGQRPGHNTTQELSGENVAKACLSSGSRNRIANESEAGGPARDVYAVAKETPSAESHPDVAEVAKGVLKSGKRCSILASEFAIHT